MQLTKNFADWEFRCHDGTDAPAALLPSLRKLAENLQALRDEIREPISIISGYRSPAHNRKIKGAKNSQHMKATAADIVVKGLTPKKLADKIEALIKSGKMHNGGLGRYATFTHYDVRAKRARWRG